MLNGLTVYKVKGECRGTIHYLYKIYYFIANIQS